MSTARTPTASARLSEVTLRPALSRGFALVLSLLLMGFILMLILSLSYLVQIETHNVSIEQHRHQAHQNALFAALMALGELQNSAGPDQRVTARAEILDDSPDAVAITGVTEPFWTGVWTTDSASTGGDAHSNPAPIKTGISDNPGGAMAWLVSTPEADPTGNARNPTDVPLLLVDADNTADPRNIYLPSQPVVVDSTTTGRYAWWVADEGVKASIAMDNPWVRSSLARDEDIARLVATRMAPELIVEPNPRYDLSLLSGLGDIQSDDAYTKVLGRVGSLEQLELIFNMAGSDGAQSEDLLKNHSHDLTALSLGVLADVRDGGLKRNLSAAFSNDTDFSTLKSEHGDLIFGHRDQAAHFDPQDADVTRAAGNSLSERRDPGGPPWEQLRSFYRMRSSSITVQPQTNTQMGVGPVISMVQMHMHVMLLEAPGSTATAPQYIVRYMVFPAVMLWNPYNVTLPLTDYSLFVTTNSNLLKYNWTPEITWTDTNGDSHTWAPGTVFEGANQADNDNGAFRFNITAALPPGEARLFVPADVEQQNWASGTGNALVDATGAGFVSGGYFYSDLPQHFTPNAAGLVLDTAQDVEMRLARQLAGGTSTWLVGIMNVELGLGVGSGGLSDLVRDGPLQSMSGFSHSLLTNPGVSPSTFPALKVWPGAIPAYADAAETPWDQLALSALGGDSYFPIIGFTQHFRWIENLHAVTYSGNGQPVVSTLASYNPRAVRNGRTPIENRQVNDTVYNSLYLNWSGNRSDNMASWQYTEPGSSGYDWGAFYTSLMHIRPVVGFSDDTNQSLISQNTLFELPSGPEYFQSIGSLMHASLSPPMPRTDSVGHYFDAAAADNSDWNVNSSYPAFAIGNSLAPLGVPLEERSRNTYLTSSNQSVDPESVLYDWSYLLNDYLWDHYFFAEYDSASGTMLNPRLIPMRGASESDITSYDKASEVLMVTGAFNVNSTSVDAWRALLGGTVGASVNGTAYGDRAPYPSLLSPLESNADSADRESAQTYAGYRTLSNAEIDNLAEAIVRQVKKRGPFISMAHFVNRVIDDPDFLSSRENANLMLAGDNRERAVGALQAALEDSIVNDSYESVNNVIDYNDLDNFEQFNRYTGMGSLSYGQPGYVTAAGLLSRLGGALSVRSDTFKIRAYGESVDPLTSETIAKAWCELVVQRLPEEHSPNSNDRRFEIVAFRWLNENEI
ncbi:hypothetical protein H5P28_06160 [Ruficoccus amylovorans]|uniref:Uncharacterized protein n=1 Tax=Ruficoccus amylovorans TaxID=1804625 RepID=A0A842HC56_9BACT|nr:hypothetical protein [Ruficoccus amylovorans]MBC2593840.1 hypothetical protein [Ruficoccus amylovorans]